MAEAKKQSKFSRIKKWFRELRSELKKVVWPSGRQIVNNTLVVLVCVLIVGVVVCLLDFGADFLLRQFLRLF